MKPWKFTTAAFSEHEQSRVWRDAMQRLCLPVGELPEKAGFRGEIFCINSPLGMEFALVDAEPHEISGRYLNQDAAIWLALLLEGKASLSFEKQRIDLVPGDIVYGPTYVEAVLRFTQDFRQLFVKAQRLTLSPRVFAPLSLKLGHLPARSGINHVFSGMLQSLAEVLEEISPEQLRPVEMALTEFLITGLGDEKSVFSLGGVSGARAYHLQRICQRIETILSEPDLTIGMVAEAEGVSTRYLQRLFTEAGNSFIHHLRTPGWNAVVRTWRVLSMPICRFRKFVFAGALTAPRISAGHSARNSACLPASTGASRREKRLYDSGKRRYAHYRRCHCHPG